MFVPPLVQNPDIVLVHYLNVPYPDDNKLAVITPSLALWGDKKEWTKEELVSQLKPMCESGAPSFSSGVCHAFSSISLSFFIISLSLSKTRETSQPWLSRSERRLRVCASRNGTGLTPCL